MSVQIKPLHGRLFMTSSFLSLKKKCFHDDIVYLIKWKNLHSKVVSIHVCINIYIYEISLTGVILIYITIKITYDKVFYIKIDK